MYKTICTIVLSLFLCAPSVFAQNERVSVSSIGDQSNNNSSSSSISTDGRFVAFSSQASNLVAGDTNNFIDIFVHDRESGLTERVSVSSSGEQGDSDSSYYDSPSLSADGRFVAFTSFARNLVAGVRNSHGDVFVHDRQTGITEQVSVSSSGEQGNFSSGNPSLSADGRFVAFESEARNIVPFGTNRDDDIYVHDRQTGITERVSVSSTGEQGISSDSFSYSENPSISAGGRFVAFVSKASNLVEGDTNNTSDIFVHDRQTKKTERVNVSSTGEQAYRGSSDSPSISADGRFVAFTSYAGNLVEGDYNVKNDYFVHDRVTGVTEWVSKIITGDQGDYYIDGPSSYYGPPSLSSDGRFVVFNAPVRNYAGNWLGAYGFLHDRTTAVTDRMKVSVDGDLRAVGFREPSLSSDGQLVAFNSYASNLVEGDTNNKNDVFVSENNLFKLADNLSVALRTTSGTVAVGEYIHFRARLTNTTNQDLSNCKATIDNPRINGQREFSFFSWPLNVNNPQRNGSIDIAPGEAGQFILAVLPRVVMRKEVRFSYACDSTQAYNVPFLNTVHLTAKTEPIIEEDYVTLANAYPKTNLVIDRGNGKYWTGYTVEVKNNGSQPASVNLSTTSDLLTVPVHLRVPLLCGPFDPTNGDWSCRTPRAEQLQVELAAGESKKIRVYVHAYRAIEKNPVRHRVVIEARDQAGKIVAKTSMGISTLN